VNIHIISALRPTDVATFVEQNARAALQISNFGGEFGMKFVRY
jgi:hypothetical protein